ncbi:MAG: HDOD domain-containing protein [Burkholderiales bacterium]|nr:HDOD domain-containing protein [Burkholderiales bacterium]
MSLDHPVLDQVVLGASALFDAKRTPIAAHMTVFPQRPDAPIDAAGLLQVIDEIAPAEAGPLMLSVAHEGSLRALLAAPTAPHLMIEVPGFMLTDPGLATLLHERVAQGLSLVLGGRIPDGAPADLWQLFQAVTVARANIRDALHPTLAFRLMRYLNSPGFGLSVEISSFRHALMILGYQRLKRWLALLVTSAIDDPDMKPLMHLAVRRGLVMEEIARPGGDDALRNELFICGVFSTLDRMMGQRFEQLLRTIPVQESVANALSHESGPLAPFLALARAIEAESAYDIREAADTLMLTVGDVNRALAKALVHAHSLTKG